MGVLVLAPQRHCGANQLYHACILESKLFVCNVGAQITNVFSIKLRHSVTSVKRLAAAARPAGPLAPYPSAAATNGAAGVALAAFVARAEVLVAAKVAARSEAIRVDRLIISMLLIASPAILNQLRSGPAKFGLQRTKATRWVTVGGPVSCVHATNTHACSNS